MSGREELAEAFQRDRERLLAVARRILRNDADAEDAVQDGFASALRSLDGFRGHARISTWLHRIVCNAALMRLRSRRRRPECPLPADPELGPADARRAADDELVVRQQSARLLRAAGGLDAASLELLDAHYLRDEPLRAIARRHRISASAAKTRLHRARAGLRRRVEGLSPSRKADDQNARRSPARKTAVESSCPARSAMLPVSPTSSR